LEKSEIAPGKSTKVFVCANSVIKSKLMFSRN